MRSLDYDVHQSNLSESDMFPSILMLTKSLKIKISNYNSISPSPYSSPYSPVFIQNKSITLQSIIDENDNKHYSMNNMLKDKSQQSYHCSQVRCIQSDCSIKTHHDRFHNQEDNLYHHDTLKVINIQNCDDNDNDVDDDHTIWDKIIPVCYQVNSNSNINESDHYPFELNETYGNDFQLGYSIKKNSLYYDTPKQINTQNCNNNNNNNNN
ncbi:unnamed protein product, partial [Schistosoma mattheei]